MSRIEIILNDEISKITMQNTAIIIIHGKQ